MRRLLAVSLLALLAASLAHGQENAGPRFRVTAVAGPGAEASALNDRGWVAGSSLEGRTRRAFLFRSGRLEELTAPGFSHTEAFGLNDAGQVVGVGVKSKEVVTRDTGVRVGTFQVRQALLWDGGQVRDLAAGEARDINNRGAVVGHPEKGPGFLWQEGRTTELTDPEERFPLHPRAINDRGEMAGYATRLPTGPQEAFLRKPQGYQVLDVGYTGGARPAAFALNDKGEVVGVGGGFDGTAFIWGAGETLPLGTLNGPARVGPLGQHAGYHFSVALGVNDRMQVVGTANVTDEGAKEMRAFLWEKGRLRDLNTLIDPNSGWVLEEARAINARGEICGVGRLGEGRRAFLLTPVN